MIEERRLAGTVQFIIATHSPLLMAYRHAEIVLFSHRGLRRATLSDTPHFRLYQDFFGDPQGFLDAANRQPRRIRVIDAGGGVAEVQERIRKEVADVLAARGGA